MGDMSLTDAEFIYSAPNVRMSGSVLSSGDIFYPDRSSLYIAGYTTNHYFGKGLIGEMLLVFLFLKEGSKKIKNKNR